MASMCLLGLSLLFSLVASSNILGAVDVTIKEGPEEWGYVEVRPKAHMFWWLYKSLYRVEDPCKPWPIVLWLQGGPGASGVGFGNFKEVGPLDTDLNPRNSTWLRMADLLFVDNPVGTGYSYVEDKNLFVQTDEEAAIDLTTLLENLFNRNQNLQKSPLYIVAESYGGKFAVTLGLSALKAIESGKLKAKLGGVALGDSWISPEDFVLSWGPLLRDVSRLDANGETKANSLAEKIKQQIKDGQYLAATTSWMDLENAIVSSSNAVDFYNFLLDDATDPVSLAVAEELAQVSVRRYSRYLSSATSFPGGNTKNIYSFMNGVIKNKLKIIPQNVTWGGQSDDVFDKMSGDFMRPRINEVDELLTKGVNVTIYNGQNWVSEGLDLDKDVRCSRFFSKKNKVDVICATKGTEAWVGKLKWEGLGSFLGLDRTPLSCGTDKITRGFTKSYKNLHFYWILGAGHFVPVDQPCIALNMIRSITQSPASAVSA